MSSAIDIWRAASVLIKEYAGDAEVAAAQRADALLAEGEIEGASFFKSVLSAINELRRTPGAGEAVN